MATSDVCTGCTLFTCFGEVSSFRTLSKLAIPKLVVLANTYMLGSNVVFNGINLFTFEVAVVTLVFFLALLFNHCEFIVVGLDLFSFLGISSALSPRLAILVDKSDIQ